MPTSTGFTQSDIDTLRAAVASGVLTVRYDGPPGRTVTYQSLPEMRVLLAQMVREQNVASGQSASARYAGFKKGV